MAYHGYDPGDRNNWYQSPQLGLFPAGYGGGISGNYYCAWSNHLQGNPYSQAQMVTNFTQPNPYPPPPHNPSATIINGHLLPHQFPCVPQTHSHCIPPPYLQPIHPIAPPSPIVTLSAGQVFDPPSPQPLTFVPQPQFPDPKPPSCFRSVGDCEPLALFMGRIQTTPSSSSLSSDPHTYLAEATNPSSPPPISGVPKQMEVLHSKLAVSTLMEELQKPRQSLYVAVAEEGNLATQVDFASPGRNRDEKLKHDAVVPKGVNLAVLEALEKGATPETLDPRTVKRLVLALEPPQSFTLQPQQALNQHHMDRFVTSPPLAQFTARPPPLLDDDDCNGMGFVFDADGIDEKLENGESVEKRTEVNSGDGREFSEPERVIGKQDEDEDEDEEQLSNGMSEFHALQLFDKMPKLDGFDDMKNDVKQPVFDAALVSARMYNERHEPHKEFAVDLEHNQYRPFQGLTCLMQISTSTADFIVDTLKLRIHIGPYLREVFKDPPKRKVMHGAGRDIVWFQRAFGIYICNFFDTGQASRVLKLERNSLDYLLHNFCDVSASKEYQNTNGSFVGNRFLNDDFGEENVSVEDSFGKMQMNSERVLEFILGKWKSRVTAKTQSEAKLVQWFILCLQLCHCETKEIILFCKEAFDGIGEMTQTSLSQVSTTLNLNFQDVRRDFESFVSDVIKHYNHSSLNCKVGAEIWPPDDGEWLDLDGETYCHVAIFYVAFVLLLHMQLVGMCLPPQTVEFPRHYLTKQEIAKFWIWLPTTLLRLQTKVILLETTYTWAYFQPEQHKWSAAISVRLISSGLHITDHKQMLEKCLSVIKSTLDALYIMQKSGFTQNYQSFLQLYLPYVCVGKAFISLQHEYHIDPEDIKAIISSAIIQLHLNEATELYKGMDNLLRAFGIYIVLNHLVYHLCSNGLQVLNEQSVDIVSFVNFHDIIGDHWLPAHDERSICQGTKRISRRSLALLTLHHCNNKMVQRFSYLRIILKKVILAELQVCKSNLEKLSDGSFLLWLFKLLEPKISFERPQPRVYHVGSRKTLRIIGVHDSSGHQPFGWCTSNPCSDDKPHILSIDVLGGFLFCCAW